MQHAHAVSVLLAFATVTQLFAQEPRGVVIGSVRDAVTGAPLPSASIMVLRSDPPVGTSTDSLGRFVLRELPVGLHALQAMVIGYAPLTVPEAWVRSGKDCVIHFALEPRPVSLTGIEVSAPPRGGMDFMDARPFTVEQGLRYPAMFQDPARLVTGTPGIVAVNDQANHLSVRGTSPNATAWHVEGAEIVSPNHLGNAGTASDLPTLSGGGVNMLSAQMLGPSQLRTGVMPVANGNALGGIMDMRLREGSREHREWTAQAGLLGLDLGTEGPIGRSRRAFHLVNYRYSTVGLLSAMGVDLGDEAITFQDLSVHAGTQLGKRGELRVFALGGTSSNVFTAKEDTADWEYDKDSKDITYTSSMGAGGLVLRLPLGERTMLHATGALSAAYQDRKESETDTSAYLPSASYAELFERKISGLVRVEHRMGARSSIEAGATALQRSMLNVLNDESNGFLLRPFAQTRIVLSDRVQASIGLGYSMFSPDASSNLEPRANVRWRPGRRAELWLAYGRRSQMPYQQVINRMDWGPAATALSTPDNKRLGLMRSDDASIGFNQGIGEKITARLEAYMQRIEGVPATWSGLAVSGSHDDALSNAWDEPNPFPLRATARAENAGVELSFARAFSDGWFANVNGSVFQSRYEAGGVERASRWDAGYTANAIAGREWRRVKEGRTRTWGVSFRVLGAGGMRYTPVDNWIRRGFLVLPTGEPYSAQLHDVYRIDLRVYLKRDRNGRTGQWSLDLQNATNARNEAFRYFDYRKGETVTRYQLGLIPNLSYRVEF